MAGDLVVIVHPDLPGVTKEVSRRAAAAWESKGWRVKTEADAVVEAPVAEAEVREEAE